MPDLLAEALTFASALSATYGERRARKPRGAQAKVATAAIVRNRELALSYKRTRAETGCEVCGWSLGADAWEALHAHHVVPLSCGGADSYDNLIALCPNHHAIAHRTGRRDYYRWTGPRSKGQLLAVLKA